MCFPHLRVRRACCFLWAQGTAAGKGSAASLDFLENAFKSAQEKMDNKESIAEGGNDRTGPNPEGVNVTADIVGGNEEGRGDEDDDSSMDSTCPGTEGRPRRGGVDSACTGSEEPPDEGRIAGGGMSGFGVVGEEKTVELALQALSRV